MDPPIVDPLDPDPPKNEDPNPMGTFLKSKYGNFYIIDQKMDPDPPKVMRILTPGQSETIYLPMYF